MDTTPSSIPGGGGADASHGLAFHTAIVILLLFTLKDISQEDLGFQYEICLEKKGYDKFDDIVLRYLSGQKWVEICVQCKHAAAIHAKITADEFLSSSKKKGFSLIDYFKSYKIVNQNSSDKERYYVILSNREYSSCQDKNYPWFKRKDIDINNDLLLRLFYGSCFQIECNNEIINHFTSDSTESIDVKDFCSRFIYICDKRDLSDILKCKYSKHCQNNEIDIKNLEGRLVCMFHKMYQQKTNPSQEEITEIFYGKQIYFKLDHPDSNFTGRNEELIRIHEVLTKNNRKDMFSVVVTGMAGMGKTQLVKKYVSENKQEFRNIIWINAENETTLSQNFTELAKTCGLTDSLCTVKYKTIIRNVYEYFKTKTLVIFDNADKNLLEKNADNEWIYLPNSKESNLSIILISQSKQWSTKTNIEIKNFSEQTAAEYLQISLYQVQSSTSELQNLAKIFYYWPLALSLAVSYIRQLYEESLGEIITISDFIKKFEMHETCVYEHVPQTHEMHTYNNKSLSTLWEIIKNKLQNDENNNLLCIRILEILSFTDADNFPITMFVPQMNPNVKTALLKLKNLSLINQSGKYLSLHRSLQAIIRNSLSDNEKFLVLENGQRMFVEFMQDLKPIQYKLSEGNLQITKFWGYILESEKLAVMSLNTIVSIIDKLCNSKDFNLGITFVEHVIKSLKAICGENHENIYVVKSIYARMLNSVDMLEKGEEEIKSVIRFYENANESENQKVLLCTSKLTLSNIYVKKGRIQEALSVINEAIDKQNNIGHSLYDIILLEQQKANILFQLMRFDEADLLLKKHLIHQSKLNCDKYEKINLLKTNNDILTMDSIKDKTLSVINDKYSYDAKLNLNMLATLNSMSSVQQKIGNYHEAITLINYVINEHESHYGCEHPDTLNAMIKKSMILQEGSKCEEALDILNNVLKIQESIFGESHFSTLSTLLKKALLLEKLNQNEEACRVLTQVYTQQKLCLFTNQKTILSTTKYIVNLLIKIKKFNQAIIFSDEVTQLFYENLPNEKSNIINIKTMKAIIITEAGRHLEALDLIREVTLPLQKTENIDCYETQQCFILEGEILIKLQNYEEALACLDMVLKVETESPYFNISITNTCLKRNTYILTQLAKYEDALTCNNYHRKLLSEIFGDTNQITGINFINLFTKATILYKLKRHKKALVILELLKKALTQTINNDIEAILIVRNSICAVLVDMNCLDLALIEQDDIVKITKERFGNIHESALIAMNDKGLLMLRTNNYKGSLTVFDDALNAMKNSNARDKNEIIVALMINKCTVLEKMFQYVQCINVLNVALVIQQKTSNIELLFILANIKTRIQNIIGDYKETIAMQTLVCSVKSSSVANKLALDTLQNIAFALSSVLQHEKALRLNEKILNWKVQNSNICYESTINSLTEITKVLVEMDRRKDALKILNFKLTSLKHKYGKEDHHVLKTLVEIIKTFTKDLNKNDEEIKILQHVKLLSEEHYGRNHQLTISLERRIAFVLQSIGKFVEAKQLLENIYKLQCESQGEDNELTLVTLTEISTLLHYDGKQEEALEVIEGVVRNQTKTLDYDNDNITQSMKIMVDIYLKMKRYDDALNQVDKITAIYEKKFGSFNIETLYTVLKKASIFQVMGKFHDAIYVFDQVIKQHKNHMSLFDIRTIPILQEKCKILNQINKNELALSCFKDIVKICKKNYGKTHLKTVAALVDTSKQLHVLEKYEEAEELLKSCLQQQTITLGVNNNETILTKYLLLQTLLERNKLEECLTIIDEMLSYELQKDVSNEVGIIELKRQKYSLFLLQMKRNEEALQLNEIVLQYYTSFKGVLNEDTLQITFEKCLILHELSRYDEALALYDEASKKTIQVFGITHENTITLKNKRIETLIKVNKYNEALEEFCQILEYETVTFGKDSEKCMKTTNAIAKLYATVENYTEALQLFDKLYNYRLKTLGKMNNETLLSLNDKALMLLMLGKNIEALEIFDNLLTIIKDLKMLVDIKSSKGFVLYKLKKYEEAAAILTESFKQKQEIFGQQHLSTIKTANTLIFVLLELESFDDAMPLLKHVLDFQKQIKENNSYSYEYLFSLRLKVIILAKTGFFSKALQVGKKVYRKHTDVLGFSHSDTKWTLKFIQDLNRFVRYGTSLEIKFSCGLKFKYEFGI